MVGGVSPTSLWGLILTSRFILRNNIISGRLDNNIIRHSLAALSPTSLCHLEALFASGGQGKAMMSGKKEEGKTVVNIVFFLLGFQLFLKIRLISFLCGLEIIKFP